MGERSHPQQYLHVPIERPILGAPSLDPLTAKVNPDNPLTWLFP
jgi:hypothetical protein